MKKNDFYFDLPPELIAQTPIPERDHSRLLCLNKGITMSFAFPRHVPLAVACDVAEIF